MFARTRGVWRSQTPVIHLHVVQELCVLLILEVSGRNQSSSDLKMIDYLYCFLLGGMVVTVMCKTGLIAITLLSGNPICRCEPGLIPKPDTITGCGPECTRDPDCQQGYVCQSQRCVPRPDPCQPSPCGPNTECMENRQGNPVCRCLPGFIPMPDTIQGCRRECEVDPDCGPGNVCNNYRWVSGAQEDNVPSLVS